MEAGRNDEHFFSAWVLPENNDHKGTATSAEAPAKKDAEKEDAEKKAGPETAEYLLFNMRRQS